MQTNFIFVLLDNNYMENKMNYRLEINSEMQLIKAFEIDINTLRKDIGKAYEFFRELVFGSEIDRRLVSIKAVADREPYLSFEVFIGQSEPTITFDRVADKLKSIIQRDYELITNETNEVIHEEDYRMKQAEKQKMAFQKYKSLGGKKKFQFKPENIGSRVDVVKSNLLFVEKIKALGPIIRSMTVREIGEYVEYDRSYPALRNLLNKENIKFKSQKTRHRM